MIKDRSEPEYNPDLEKQNQMLNRLYFLSQLAEQQDRRRIFLKFQEGLIQKLVDVRMRLDALVASGDLARDRIDEFQKVLRSAIADARVISGEICPHVLYEMGLKAALRELLQEHRRTGGINYFFKTNSVDIDVIGEPHNIILYHLVQQLLSGFGGNSYDRVTLWLGRDGDGIEMWTVNDNPDFDLQEILDTDKHSMELVPSTLYEKICLMGGEIQIGGGPDSRTVSIELPLNNGNAGRRDGN